MNTRFVGRIVAQGAALLAMTLLAAPCGATLKFYYDPDTGNVSFDTTESRTGSLYAYAFEAYTSAWKFRAENLIRLSNSTLFTALPTTVGEGTVSAPWRGLYSIGDVFPIGLSETELHSTVGYLFEPTRPVQYLYADQVGGGDPPPAQLIYGRPTGEFVNRWDLVDPNTLDWATAATLVYRPWSGEVLIDTTGDSGGYISGIVLASAGQFIANDFDPFFHGPAVEATEDLIALFGDAFEPGRYSLGQVLRAGMTHEEFESLFSRAEFFARAGFRSAEFNYDAEGLALSVQYVPEPSSIAFALIAILCSLIIPTR